MSNKIEEFIIQQICTELKISKLEDKYKSYAMKLFRLMDRKVFQNYKLSDVGPILGKILGNQILQKIKLDRAENPFELREYQKAALGSVDQDPAIANKQVILYNETKEEMSKPLSIKNFLNIDNLYKMQLYFNPDSLNQYHYIALETKYRDTSTDSGTTLTKFSWKYTPTTTLINGFTNSAEPIKDVIGIRLYQPRIPYLPAMNTSAKRVSLLVEEFKAQAFIAENGRRFHFLLCPVFVAFQSYIELVTEDYNDNVYWFRDPITEFSSLTVSFGDPLELLVYNIPVPEFLLCFEFICRKSDK